MFVADILKLSRPISDMMIIIMKLKCKSVVKTEKGPLKYDVIKIIFTKYLILIEPKYKSHVKFVFF